MAQPMNGIPRNHFPQSGMAGLDIRQGAQRPVTRFQTMEKIGDFLSPAEAEFAYEGAGKENLTPDRHLKLPNGKVDSPLDIINEERHLVPLVSPLAPSFNTQPPTPMSMTTHDQDTTKPSANDHIQEIVPIFVELRTNVIVKDEYRLVTELSSLLARLYFCSQDGISVNVDHSACLMLAASFDPAYILNITTTPQHLDYDINSSNTLEIQRLMHQILSVPTHRGILRFQTILEENVGLTGSTVAHLNHRTPQQLHQARQVEAGSNDTDAFGSTNGSNPLAPPASSANKVLRQQITSMTEPERKMSVRSGVSSITATDLAVRLPEHQENSSQLHEHRRNQSDMTLNFHRPRPISTYSSRFREGSVDWRPTMPTPGSDDQQLEFFPPVSQTSTSHDTDTDSRDSGTAAPPPIPHNRGDNNDVKASKRRSLFAVFKR